MPLRTIKYRRDVATDYADAFALSYNTAMFRTWDEDCTNFVSQVLWAGDLPFKRTGDAGRQWWYDTPGGAYTGRSASWPGAHELLYFLRHNSDTPRIRQRLADSAAELKAGDLLFGLNGTGNKTGRTAYHAGIFSRYTNGTVYCYAHTSNKRDEPWGAAPDDTYYMKLDDNIALEYAGAGLEDSSWSDVYGTSNWKKGNKNTTYIKKIQEDLNALGYNCGTPDGIFGTGTESAVISFQYKQYLTDDGIVGPATKRALKELSA